MVKRFRNWIAERWWFWRVGRIMSRHLGYKVRLTKRTVDTLEFDK